MCRKTLVVIAVLATAVLALGGIQDARATQNPNGCTDTGPALLIRILDPNGVAVPQGTAFYVGTTIQYVARLIYDELPQCAYQGGSLCMESPAGSACTNVTPGGGIPLLCDDAINCNPLGVGQVLSNPDNYVVNRADIDPPPSDCPDLNSIRAIARYTNGSSFGDPDPNEVVFPINADTPACIVALFCGDGIVNGPEECDDGNTNNADSCRNDCTITPFCGDGTVDPGETCDPPGSPAGANGNLCRDDCSVCGDGIVDLGFGEECDDGDSDNNDACRNNCMLPACGDEIVNPPETCDPPGEPAGANDNLCRENCTVCGDGVVNGGEECDDGDTDDNDACRNNCTIPPFCGDEVVDPGETCDPPGSPAGENGNLCREDCTVCGDGESNGDEECDDGNGIDDDMCANDCTAPVGEEICRTPGFWGTHAGVEKTRSQNITQALIDFAGGFVICGENITTTDVDDAASAVEAICKHTAGVIERQLARQLTAAALNCIISGGGDDCVGSPLYSGVFGDCNEACADKNSGLDVPRSELTACIAEIDCLNNGGIFGEGLCEGNSGCHDRELVNEDLGFDFAPPGPAGSSDACQDANKSPCGVLALDEGECSTDSAP